MTIQEVIAVFQKEKQNNLPSRFPCRAVMVSTIGQYTKLLSELKKISDIWVIKSSEILSSADIMPDYSKLCSKAYRNEWVILTGVGEYLRLFSQKEVLDRRFASLWAYQQPASSTGRIIIPLWGCEAQWFDGAIGLNNDIRQEDFYFDCTTPGKPEQTMSISVVSDMFEQYLSMFGRGGGMLCVGLLEWFEYWENPSEKNSRFILLTKRYRSILPVKGNITIKVTKDISAFVRENITGGEFLTDENCSEEMSSELLPYVLQENSLDGALLKILNVSAFSGVDIMGKWNTLSLSRKKFAALWLEIHPDNSYLNHCFTIAGSVKEIPYLIYHEIFKKRTDRPEWVDEFKKLSSVMMIKPDPEYFKAVDAIPEFENRLDYISNNIKEEKIYLLKMTGQWLRKDPEQADKSKKLKESIPALSAYLSNDLPPLKNDTGDYLLRYKIHKLENSLPEDEEAYFGNISTEAFDYRYAVLSEYEDKETFFLWIDALGIEWLSLLYRSITAGCGGKIIKAVPTLAALPTETRFNEQWKSMEKEGIEYKKLNKLDKLAHKGVIDEPDYYACIEEQFSFMDEISKYVDDLLGKYRRVVITGDRGTSRLAARFFHGRDGIEAPKNTEVCCYGRYCKLPPDTDLYLSGLKTVKNGNERYAVFCNYDHFKQPGFAAGVEDENPVYGEIHGGGAPEEVLVPVIVVESSKEIPLSAVWEKDTVKISGKKAMLKVLFNSPVENLSVKTAGIQAEVSKENSGKAWKAVFSGIKPGKYTVSVIADGRIADLAEITLLSALGGGGGDLP
ncbi:MAG: BREX-4 system phosphatase PglZ [Clostridiales bacterium]|nr:BREX-4 system phosphatase PglZ [Clostridiales bacterium]